MEMLLRCLAFDTNKRQGQDEDFALTSEPKLFLETQASLRHSHSCLSSGLFSPALVCQRLLASKFALRIRFEVATKENVKQDRRPIVVVELPVVLEMMPLKRPQPNMPRNWIDDQPITHCLHDIGRYVRNQYQREQ